MYGLNRLAPSLSARCSRVIFLDFDGVMHPPRAIAGARPPLEPHEILTGWPATFQHLGILQKMLEGHADIAVVVSSSWRMFLTDEQLGELLEPIGWLYWQPSCRSRRCIRAWLEVNAIADYVVLDDRLRFFPGLEKDWPSLILCESELGISDPAVQKKLEEWINRHADSLCRTSAGESNSGQ